MAGETKRALRRAWFQVHKWIGLVLMIGLIPLSLTGSALVWDEPLDRALNPGRYAVSGDALLPPAAYAAAARAVLPGGERLAAIRYPGDGGGPVVVSAMPVPKGPPRPGPMRRDSVWLDPPTARVLDHGQAMGGALRWLHVFHGQLQIPVWGRTVVGWLGIAMALSCLSGLWLWWPAGRLTRGLRWARGDRRFDTNLHHQLGFWIVLPLGMLSVTGAWIAFPGLMGSSMPRDMTRAFVPAATVHLSPDAALAAAVGGGPARGLRSITWPAGDGAWHVALGRREVAVDDASGAALPPARSPRDGGEWSRTVRRWHDGEGMGPVWRWAITLAGLAPLVLGATALTMWLRSRRWRKAPRRAAAERVAA